MAKGQILGIPSYWEYKICVVYISDWEFPVLAAIYQVLGTLGNCCFISVSENSQCFVFIAFAGNLQFLWH